MRTEMVCLPKGGPRNIADILAADGLDRFEIPFFGRLASSFVDSE